MEDIKNIPGKATDEEKYFKKQMGCMNGFLQLFDRHHFITGGRVGSHSSKRLLQGAGRRQGPQNTEKDPEALKEKPRMSTESSQASCSSSTCSTSTFSSIDCNRTAQPETFSQRQNNIPESPLQIIAPKTQLPPLMKSMQPLDLRDIVKESMYRETRGLAIKHLATYGSRGTVMKHVDSPRPLQQPKLGKPKTTGCKVSPRDLAKDHEHRKNSKEERPILHRFSYDGKDSQETIRWGMKQREPPRLSLDSKSTSLKSSTCESRLGFPSREQRVESESSIQALQSNQESGSQQRSSSIVAKLMGLETLQFTNFLDESTAKTLSSCPKETSLSTSTTAKSRQDQDTYSPRIQKSNPAISSRRLQNANYMRKPPTCSKLPMERAPWRQQAPDSQVSLRMASHSRKVATSTSQLSSSVYGEIEKRIAELEFKQSGKDLRALKQILSAMEKTRERLENERGEAAEVILPGTYSTEKGCSAQNSILSLWENVQSYHQVLTAKGPGLPTQLGSSDLIMKPAKMMDKINLPTQAPTAETLQLQILQTQVPIHHREISVYKQKANDISPKNNKVKDPSRNLPSPHKTTWRSSEVNRIVNSTNSGRNVGMLSPRLRQNPLSKEEQSNPSISSSESNYGLKKQCSKKHTEKGFQSRKHKGRTKESQLNDDQLSELSSETRCSSNQGDTASVKSESNNSQLSQREKEVVSLGNTTDIKARQKEKEKSASTRRKSIPAVENAAILLEQPSPISVLDDMFYIEDSPSPVKKTSTGFRDEIPSSGEAERDLKNSKHSTANRRSDHDCKYNQKSENMKQLARQLSFMHTEPDKIAATDNTSVNGSCNSNHRYITKILLTSGLLKDLNFFSTTEFIPSCHLINPDIFHVLEQTENTMDLKGEASEKNENMQLNKKLQRRIIFDIVNEILVRKIHSGRYTVGNKSPQALLKEVYLEMDHLCGISDCNFDDEKEKITRHLPADMLYPYEDWADYRGEFPAIVLDIERRIFKDLINEVITSELTGICGQPKRHCRRLFSQ